MQRISDDNDVNRAYTIATLFFPEFMARFNVGYFLIVNFINWFPTCVEVFIRYGFGERYLTWNRMILSALTLLGVLHVYDASSPRTSIPSGLTEGLIIAIAISAFLHMGWRTVHSNRTKPVHSQYIGSSILELTPFLSHKHKGLIYGFLEPLFVILLGSLIWASLNPVIGDWLVISGIALWRKNRWILNYEKHRKLDLQDARIEAEHRASRARARLETPYVVTSATDGNNLWQRIRRFFSQRSRN